MRQREERKQTQRRLKEKEKHGEEEYERLVKISTRQQTGKLCTGHANLIYTS